MSKKKSRTVTVMTGGFHHGGAPRNRAHLGPDALLAAGLLRELARTDIEIRHRKLDAEEGLRQLFAPVQDHEDWPDALSNRARVGELGHKMSDIVYKILRKKSFPLVFGADHSLSLGPIAGALRYAHACGKRLGVIVLDQHLDAHTHETSQSGNPHGMQFAALMGHGCPHLTSVAGAHLLDPADLVYIGTGTLGTNSYEHGEDDLLRMLGVKRLPMPLIERLKLKWACENIAAFASTVDMLYLTIDHDVTKFPSVHYPYELGFNWSAMVEIVNAVVDTGKLIAADYMEFAPVANDPYSPLLIKDLARRIILPLAEAI